MPTEQEMRNAIRNRLMAARAKRASLTHEKNELLRKAQEVDIRLSIVDIEEEGLAKALEVLERAVPEEDLPMPDYANRAGGLSD